MSTYISKIPLYRIFNYILYCLYTGCQRKMLPTANISYHSVYYHYRKWCENGSFRRVWDNSIGHVRDMPNLSCIFSDGTHTIAKKGGEAVACQGRKKAETCNILPVSDKNGYIIASSSVISGNHNDAYNLKSNLQDIFKDIKKKGLNIGGSFFNADKGSDTGDARKVCFNHGVIPNIPENKRNRKYSKRGRKRLFNPDIYRSRFGSEKIFAWIDKFRRLLIRFEHNALYFIGFNHIAFAMINLRKLLN